MNNETKEKLILSLLGLDDNTNTKSFYEIGKVYIVRSVTMIYLGKLKSEDSVSLVFEECAWIPDTSRWSEFLAGKKPNEMEPYCNDVIVYKTAILDATELTKNIKIELI